MMPAIKPIARIIEINADITLEILYDSKKFTTGNSNTARSEAKAKGIKMFCATLIKKQIKKITRNLKPSFT